MSQVMSEPVEQVQQGAHLDEKAVEQASELVEQPVQKQGKSLSFPRLINSPWVLLAAPLMAGAVWLASNTWVITNNLDKPYALLAGPALAASVLVLWLTIKFFQSIIAGSKAAWHAFQRSRKEDGSAQFFWIVIVVFMIVSVFASGSFFSKIEHDAVPGLGYATALFIDLVAVQAMRARLNAVRMRDKKGSRLYLFGVLLCAGASAFANVYTSLADFTQTSTTGALPPWMLEAAPWFGLVFPALILLLSMTADYTIDQISTKLDPEQYKAQELKRTKLLEYQRDALKDRLQFEREIDSLTTQLRDGKERRVFFLVNWFFPKQTLDVSGQLEDLKNTIEKQLFDLSQKADYLYQFTNFLQSQSQQNYQLLQTHFANFSEQHETDLGLISGQLSDMFSSLDALKSWSAEPEKVETFEDENDVLEDEDFIPESNLHLPTTGDLKKLPSTDPQIHSFQCEKVTRKLSLDELEFEAKEPQKVEQKVRPQKPASIRSTSGRTNTIKLSRNVYTNSEAAKVAKCSVSEIETALKNGELSMSKSGDKILKSSLEKFISERRQKRNEKLSLVK